MGKQEHVLEGGRVERESGEGEWREVKDGRPKKASEYNACKPVHT